MNVTDVYSGWTESRAGLGRGQAAVVQALEEIAQALPFRRLGIDTDNGSDFLKGHVWAGVRSSSRADDPTRKTTTPNIEQKNWTHVRKLMGWEGYDTAPAVEAMNDLYRHELRLRMNVFQPSVKLVRKGAGARLRRVYDAARTPQPWRACRSSRGVWIRSS